jgi:hypothetical protein
MKERPKCSLCGKEAIGFQSVACSYFNVCEEHADSHLLALRPGEKQAWGESCFFERFSTPDE